MSSNWTTEVLAVFRKEAQSELRDRTGIVTGGVFSFATVVTVALAMYNHKANNTELQDVCASLVWVILLFASLLTLPRTFLAEEEQGTADILRLTARPHAVFWGKVLFNLALMWAIGLFATVLFLILVSVKLTEPGVFIGCLIGGGAALTGAVTLCGAIASQATNRSTLAGLISIPLVLVPCQLGVAGFREAFGSQIATGGTMAVIGLTAYAVLSLAIGPWIYATVWKG